MKSYEVQRARATPELKGEWDGKAWGQVAALEIDQFRTEGHPNHHPRTRAKLLYDDQNLYVFWLVQDRYVTCTRTRTNEQTHRDSCVEIFVQPRGSGTPHFAIEINCGGTVMMAQIIDPRRTADKFADWRRLEPRDVERAKIYHSLPKTVSPEISDDIEWRIEAAIPLSVLETYAGEKLAPLAGQTWRANLYKCADDSSHPHFAAWSVVGGKCNFHQPEYFGELRFAD
jgi:hypothetical protein